MRKSFLLLLGSIISVFSLVQAQDGTMPIYLSNGTQFLSKNIDRLSDLSPAMEANSFDGAVRGILQFKEIPSAEQRAALQSEGIQLLQYLPEYAYLAEIVLPVNQRALTSSNARALYLLTEQDKTDPSCYAQMEQGVFYVHYYSTLSASDVLSALPQLTEASGLRFHEESSYFTVSYQADLLPALANAPVVYYVRQGVLEQVSHVSENPNTNRSNTINTAGYSGAEGLTGKGVNALIVDGGYIEPHLDVHNRVVNLNNRTYSSYGEHAELVTSVFGGAGNLDPYHRGVAYKTNFHTIRAGELLDYIELYYNQKGVTISNNSYGSRVPNYGAYTSDSRSLDLFCNDNKSYLHFSSASNEGAHTYGSYPQSFHTVTDNFQTAKNGLTLSNISIYDTIMPSSSRGPAKDGRIKPDVGASGNDITYLSRGNDYRYILDGGTSSATPSTAGVAALLSEWYQDLYSSVPDATLLKSVLLNTADDIGNEGPDFTYGYGRINARRALNVLKSGTHKLDSVANNVTNTFTVNIPAGLSRFKIMLNWNDPAAAVLASRTLVNDLDLEVIAPNTAIYRPWILKHAPANVEDLALTGRDSINNVEQVTALSPMAGNWTVRVKGNTVTAGKQSYYVTWEKLEDDITLTFPHAQEKFEPGQTFLIRWDAFDGSSNDFTLEYTTNNGNNWTTIDNAIDGDLRFYEWTTPNVSSGACKVRVSRNGTSDQDASNEPFAISARPTGLTARALCTDYTELSWNAVTGAQSYNIWYLDTVMKVLRTVTGTKDTLSLSPNHNDNWFGVSANFTGFEGQRCNSVRPTASTSRSCPYAQDLSVLDLVTPVSGRKDFSSELTTTESVTMRCINVGSSSISNFKLHYKIGSGSTVTETYSGSLSAGDTLLYTFSTTANLSAIGTYSIDVWTSHASDAQVLNDSLLGTTFSQLANPAVAIPFLEEFGNAIAPDVYTGENKSISGYPYLDLESDANAQIRFDVGNGVFLEAQSTSAEGTNYLTFNLNLAAHSAKSLAIRFDWTQYFESRDDEDKLWIRGADTMPWIEVLDFYDEFGGYDNIDQVHQSPVIALSDLLAQNNQSLTASTQIRFGQRDNGVSVRTAFPYVGSGGVQLDNFEVFEAAPDIELVSFDAPEAYNCGYAASSTFTATVRNKHGQSQTGVQVRFQLDNNAVVSKTLPAISANSTATVGFNPLGISVGWHTAKFWTVYASDTFPENNEDSLRFFNSRRIQFFPYTQDFETNDGDWWTDGKNSSWEWGSPSSTDITAAGSGSKCWNTQLLGIHNAYEFSYLNSPCFATGNFKQNDAVLEALVFGDSKRAWIEYTNDNGANWTKLGAHGEGENWYNNVSDYWDGSFRGWHKVRYDIPNSTLRNNDQIMFRFVFSADDNFNWQEGFAIDSFSLKVLNQDLELLSLEGPSTRCGLTDNETLQIRVANLSRKATTWAPVRYKVNNGAVIKDSIPTVPGEDTVLFTLALKHDFTDPIEHQVDIWMESELDRTRANDSVVNFRFISKPQVSAIPYLESFENNIGGWHSEGAGSSWEQGSAQSNHFPNSASHGSKVWATNLTGNHNAGEVSYLVSPCFDVRGIQSDPYLEFHAHYSLRPSAKFYVEYSEDGATWNTLGANGSGLKWYNHVDDYFNGSSSEWTKSRWQIDLSGVTDSSSLQFRFVLENDVNDLTAASGVAIDNVRLYEIRNDLELVQITSPDKGCGLGNSEDIEVQVRNNSAAQQTNATVNYSINGGPTQSTALASINANSTQSITLSSNADFSASGAYELKTWVAHGTDTYQDNDTVTFRFLRSNSVSGFPYQEGFENANGGWFGTGNNSSWAWGNPSGAPIQAAAEGQKVWGSNLSGSYNASELSYLNSPCFDLSGFTGEAHITFEYYRYLAAGTEVWMEYSDDDGNTWNKLGSNGEGFGWYNDAGNSWKGQANAWGHARIRLPLGSITNKDKLRFRFVLRAGNQTAAGWAIDDFQLFEAIDDVEVIAIESPDAAEGTGTKTVRIQVTNHSAGQLNDVKVKYQLDAQTVAVDTIPQINANDSLSFTFQPALQLTTSGNPVLKAWAEVSTDNRRNNDTSQLNMTVEATIASFPYYEGFEGSSGDWTTSGFRSSWEWGSPDDALNDAAHTGDKCWATNLDGEISRSEVSYLTSPLFDFRSFSNNPVISFYNSFNIDWQSQYYVEYTEDGNSWTKIGSFGSGQNWYNNGGNYWSQSELSWLESLHEIPLGQMSDSSKVRLRFVLAVGQQNNYPGIAIDDIFVGEKGNDLEVIKLTAPDTSCALGNSETVSVQLRNLSASASGTYSLSYQLNGGNVVTQSFSSFNAGTTTTVSFTTKADLSQVQKHDFKVWSSSASDHYHLNDTLEVSTYKSATVSTFPYVQGFESGFDDWIPGGANSSWEVGSPSSTSFSSAATGSQCVATNLDGHCNYNEFSYLISPCFDFRGMGSNPSILFNLAYKLGWSTPGLYVEYSEDGTTWNKLGSSGSGQNWYNNNWDEVWDQSSTTWKLSIYEIPLNTITDSSAVKFRFVLKGSPWATEEGVVIDDVRIQEIKQDLELLSINGPVSGAGLGQETVQVQVRNNSNQTITNAFLYYRLDGGMAVKDTIASIGSGVTATFNFTQKINASSSKTYVLDAWMAHADDNQPLNDSLLGYLFTNTSYINSFPYWANFDNDDGTFYPQGNLSTWEHGQPSVNNTRFKKAASGTKLWATNLDGKFNLGEQSYLYSPIFDLSGFAADPILSLSLAYELGFTVTLTIQYSEDGSTWSDLTSSTNGINWVDWGWSGDKTHLHTVSTEIPVASMTESDSVQFRVYFNDQGWGFETYEGVVMDNFHIHEKAVMHRGNSARGLTKTVSGSGWVHFEKNGSRVVSIHPQGQNLGSTEVDCYIHQGNNRSYSNQYILDRSWVIEPTTQPNSDVLVRLYFTEEEVDSMRMAGNCQNCTSIEDAYELGFTKYHGVNEDSILSNNTSGTYAYFSSSSINMLPYGRGYCAEFAVSSFSEIFGNDGGSGGNAPLPVDLLYFDAEARQEGVVLEWQTATELNNDAFEVQRSTDGIHFETIATVQGQGTTAEMQSYSHTDSDWEVLNAREVLFYRLQQNDFGGQTAYSKTVTVLWEASSASTLQAWPTALTTELSVQNNGDEAQRCALRDVNGELLMEMDCLPGVSVFDLSFLAKGVYYLQPQDKSIRSVRLVKVH